LQDGNHAGEECEEVPALPAVSQGGRYALISGPIARLLDHHLVGQHIPVDAVLWLDLWLTWCTATISVCVVIVQWFSSAKKLILLSLFMKPYPLLKLTLDSLYH